MYLEQSPLAGPYSDDPDRGPVNTSREGARAIAGDAHSLRERYVKLLVARGLAGLTDQEAADALGIQRTTLIPRRAELAGHVKWTGKTRTHRAGTRRVPNKVWALAVFVDGVEPIDARVLA